MMQNPGRSLGLLCVWLYILSIVDENSDADFIRMVGNRAMIKRKLFEEYIDPAAAE